MYLIVNEIELAVNNAYTERDANTNTLSAIIEVPYESMDFTSLKTLFMEHSGIITKVLDDGSTESWDGFKYDKPPVDDGEKYRIVLVGNEESYQIERLRYMEVVLAEKEDVILAKEVVISEKETTITEQKETITVLENTVAELEKALGEGETGGISEEEIMNAVMEGVEEV